jgi:hypothetical protein
MEVALIYCGASFAALVFLSSLYLIEDAKGGRIVLSRVRGLLDAGLMKLLGGLQYIQRRLWSGFVHVILRYGVHTFLSGALAFLRRLEKRVEGAVRKNRQAVRKERQSRNHLDEIADHKQAVALSDEEKRRLRDE